MADGVGALAVDAGNGVWAGVRADHRVYRLDGATGAVLETVDLSDDEFEPGAAVVDGGGRVWIAGWPSTELLRLDAAGKVWTLGPASSLIERLDPDTNRNDLDVQLADGGDHGAVANLTGVVSRSLTTRIGSWRAVFDSLEDGAPWGTVGWTGTSPAGAATRVRVRSSEDATVWSSWEEASSGVELMSTPAGRGLQVEVTMQLLSGQDLPRLDELTITPAAAADLPVASFSWAPGVPVAGEPVQLADESIGDPTSWSWDFDDGAAGTEQNPVHSWAAAGVYAVGLTVSNAVGSDTANTDLTVAPAGGCLLTCQTAVPAAGTVGEPVDFEATTTAAGCSGAATLAWSFGDGASATDDSAAHTYGAAGRWDWRLDASADGATCARTGSILIGGAADGCGRPQWIPVTSHAIGAQGSVWRTDVGLLGVAGGAGVAELRLHAADGVTSRELTVTASAMVDLADGTFGQRLDGVEPSAGLAAGDVVVLPHLREDDRFRTNLGFTNAGVERATVAVTLRDGAGNRLGTYGFDLAPGRWRQDNRPFSSRGGTTDLAAGSVRLEVTAGAGVLVYASVVDNLTGDALTVLPRMLDGDR